MLEQDWKKLVEPAIKKFGIDLLCIRVFLRKASMGISSAADAAASGLKALVRTVTRKKFV